MLFWAADPVLQAQAREAEAEACYEKLSLLYVALTRAKRGLYVITKPVGTSDSPNFPQMLARTLGTDSTDQRVGKRTFAGPWSSGNPDWARQEQRPTPAVEAAEPGLRPLPEVREVIRRGTRRPTAEAGRGTLLARVFTLDPSSANEFGARVHELLASVPWADDTQRTRQSAEWASQGSEAEQEAAAILDAPELAEIWQRPAGEAEVWRERAFEAILGDSWVTGRFDRVVLTRDSAQKPVGAVIYDFKTDRVATPEEVAAASARHQPQLQWYRQAVQALTGLSLESIRCEVVFTRVRQRVIV